MPNTVLEMSPLACSSHSIHIDDLPSLPPDSDKKNSPLASRLTRVNNSAEELNVSDSENDEIEVLAEGKRLHHLASSLNSSSYEFPVVKDQNKNGSWKNKTLWALGLLGVGALIGAKVNAWGSKTSVQPQSLDMPRALPLTIGGTDEGLPYARPNRETESSQPANSQHYNIDLSYATPVGNRTATSSGGQFYKLGDKSYFVKPGVGRISLTPQQQRFFASSEVASNTLTRLFATGTEGAPVSFIGTLSGIPHVATETIDFNELGKFFRKDKAISNFAASHPEMEADKVVKLKANAIKISEHYRKMKELEKSRPNDWWETKDKTFVDNYRAEAQPFRELILEGLKLLPDDIQKMVQEHIVIGQIVGDWDFLNERFENIGISKNSDGQYRAASLDRGISFGVGFWGKSKPEGYLQAVSQRPPAFLPLESEFAREKAVFGSDLPELGKDFSYMPYADVAKLSSGKAEWLPETLKKIAYRVTVANEHNLIHKILNDTLIDVSDAGLEDHQFLDKAQTQTIFDSRLQHVIEQAGGIEAVRLWALNNAAEAQRISVEVAAIEKSLGY